MFLLKSLKCLIVDPPGTHSHHDRETGVRHVSSTVGAMNNYEHVDILRPDLYSSDDDMSSVCITRLDPFPSAGDFCPFF